MRAFFLNSKYKILLLIALISGFILRIQFIKLIPQPFVFDQFEYHNFAQQILSGGLTVWNSRLYGYPIFLAAIYKLAGAGNLTAVYIVQAAVDSLTGLLIYSSARKLYRKEITAISALILYLVNPFTSAFTGVLLTEVWAIFLSAFIFYLFILWVKEERNYILPFLALVLGYFPQVRPAFLFYSLATMGGVFYIYAKQKSGQLRPGKIALSIILFCLPFTWNIAGNIIKYKSASVTTVDNLFVRELYISLFVPGRSPFHANSPAVFPLEVQKLYDEYSILPGNPQERNAMAQKYLNLSLLKIRQSPAEFIISRAGKVFYVWEKHFIYYYNQPDNKMIGLVTYWGNILLLSLATTGIILRAKNEKPNKYIVLYVIFMLLYVSVIHSISLAEERYSLPAYPLVFLFAGYIIGEIIQFNDRNKLQK